MLIHRLRNASMQADNNLVLVSGIIARSLLSICEHPLFRKTIFPEKLSPFISGIIINTTFRKLLFALCRLEMVVNYF